jgi:TldD protein
LATLRLKLHGGYLNGISGVGLCDNPNHYDSLTYLIENGKVTRPVKGATLIGNGPEVLKHVSMLGNDLQLDPGVGTCGKEGQSVPVGVGQPTMLIDKLTVGGTSS